MYEITHLVSDLYPALFGVVPSASEQTWRLRLEVADLLSECAGQQGGREESTCTYALYITNNPNLNVKNANIKFFWNLYLAPSNQHTCVIRKSDCLGSAVLLCLVVCLTLLASFFLPSFSFLIKTCNYMYMLHAFSQWKKLYMYTHLSLKHVHVYMYMYMFLNER